jgi:hypothetical protein
MWPRLLTQLLELLPHIHRLVPLADRYFTSRSAREQAQERAQEAALAALAETLRLDLANLSRSQTSLGAQLESQAAQLAHISVQVDHDRVELVTYASQLETVTQQFKRLHVWVVGSAILSALLLLSILALLLRGLGNHPT